MRSLQPDVSDAGDESVSSLPLDVLRERAKARRRRESLEAKDWNVVDSRRQKLRMFAVSVGALLLMGLGLYFELTHQDSPPPDESVAPAAAVGTIVA